MLKPTRFIPPHPHRPYPPRYIKLSKRELDILRWMSAGKSDWEIGMILQISKKTVNWHVERIKRKFAVPTRIQTVLLAERSGLLGRRPARATSHDHPNGGERRTKACVSKTLGAEFIRLIGQRKPTPAACAINLQPIVNLKTVLRDLAT